MQGGGRGIEAFCVAEHPRLVTSMTVYTGDAELAAELAQEALARVHRDWPRVSRMASPGGCAHRIAVNLANSYLRRTRLERRAHARMAVRAQPRPNEPDDSGVLRLAAGLPRRQREAVALRFLLDLSVDQTAARWAAHPGRYGR